MSNKNTVNENIKNLRKKAHLTQEEMGAILGMKRSTYAHTESYGNFKSEDLKKIALHFERTVDELIYGDNIFTRIAVEEMKKPSETSAFHEEQLESPIKYSDDIIENTITANERKIIRFYRLANSKSRDLILKLIEELSTKE